MPSTLTIERAPGGSEWSPPSRASRIADRSLTGLIVIGPFVALALLVPMLWGDLLSVRDGVIGLALYLVSGFGITVGYHRLFTHRSFKANRPLKLALAAAGSTAIEGSLSGWVANHRRHHRFSDRPGDPHSPRIDPAAPHTPLRRLAHAHVGWLFSEDDTSAEHYAPDILADRDLARMSSLWGVFAIGSLVLPFVLGWVLSGTVAGGLTTFLWAGLVRMVLLHHATWSINSLCHMFGEQPFRTRDQSGSIAALGIVSMGESFHNFHHADPTSARHGVLPHQPDASARLIRIFEGLGWATEVRWPSVSRLERLRVTNPPPPTAAD